jgi:hypothetical protein
MMVSSHDGQIGSFYWKEALIYYHMDLSGQLLHMITGLFLREQPKRSMWKQQFLDFCPYSMNYIAQS